MTTPAKDDRSILVRTADGQVVPFKITPARSADDRCVPVITASGKPVMMLVKPVLVEGEKGIPILCADGKVVLVRELSGGPPGRCFTGTASGGDYSSSVIYWNEDQDTFEPYHNKAGYSSTYAMMIDGFGNIFTHGCVVGDDVFITGNEASGWDGVALTSSGCPGVYKYDRSTNTFIRISSETWVGGSPPHWAGAGNPAILLLAWGTKLVTLGAVWYGTGFTPEHNVNIFDPSAGTWVHIANPAAPWTGATYRSVCAWGSGFVIALTAFNHQVWYCDGTTLTQLGANFNNLVAEVFVDDSGNLYAAGNFTNVGPRIVKWNTGTLTWDAVGGGINGVVGGAWSHGDKIICDSNAATSCGSGANQKTWTLDALRERVVMSYDPVGDSWTYKLYQCAREQGYMIFGANSTAPHAWKYDGVIYLTYGNRGTSSPAGGRHDEDDFFGSIYIYSESESGTPQLTRWMNHSFWSDAISLSGQQPAITNALLKLSKAAPEDDQLWFIAGSVGIIDPIVSDQMPNFDGTDWIPTRRSLKTYGPGFGTNPVNGLPKRGFTVAGRNFYIPDQLSVKPPPSAINRLLPLVEFGSVDDNSYPIPPAWSGYMAGEEFRIWFPDYRFYYYGPTSPFSFLNQRYGGWASACGFPIMHDDATGKSILHMPGGYCLKDPINGDPDTNFAGAVEIDWANQILAAVSWDHGYASASYTAHAYCNGNWYALRYGTHPLMGAGFVWLAKYSGGSWSDISPPQVASMDVSMLATVLFRLTDTQLVTYCGSTPSTGKRYFYLYDTTSGTWTAHWNLTDDAKLAFEPGWNSSGGTTTDRIFFTQESGTLYLWGRFRDYIVPDKNRLMKLDILGKSVAFRSQTLWQQPGDGFNIYSMIFPTKEALYIQAPVTGQNGGRYIKNADGTYVRGLGLFQYDFGADEFVQFQGTIGTDLRSLGQGGDANFVSTIWGDETCDYGNRLIISP